MAHFAKLDENNIVLEVIVVHNNELMENGIESETKGIQFLIDWSGGYSNWKQTSYSRSFRKNYAGIGYSYMASIDAFVPPQPFPSWVLNQTDAIWCPPIQKPNDNKEYVWDESTTSWVESQQP